MKYILIITLLIINLWSGDFEKGQEAFDKDNYKLASHYWEPLAKNGDMFAERKLGLLYEHTGNNEKSIKWLKISANNGHTLSQLSLGGNYLYGLGVKKNLQEALKWYKLASKQGDGMAQRTVTRICRSNPNLCN